MSEVSPEVIAAERALLAAHLRATVAGPVRPGRRPLVLRQVGARVEKCAVSAGCFGEVVQWRLKGRGPT